ncbi:MAG: 5-formyltetrahydrofolate cyclo-ligase [Flavobacteriaceae bacterium]|nr:5-formyltetrahydrofolate cyclo-ligase [Bacteroidia bacterium]NNL15115.1 5-formyltetrahydrofolate cyclo-ligase [Flavobacteriaceae bacterium]
MTKIELRKKYKKLRSSLSSNEIVLKSIAIANNSLKLPIWNKNFYHLFLSIIEHNEVDTGPLLSVLSGKDKNIVLSKSDFKTQTMDHFLLTDSTIIQKNKWNIPEPVNGIAIPSNNIDVVFVPLLAFDEEGNRVGYGKGFYDIFLSECKPEIVKIGLSFFEVEEQILDTNKNDIALDFCVTPNRTYNF